MILPVLLFARLTLSFSLSFPRVPFPVLSVPRTFYLPLARSSSPSRARRRSLSLAFAVVLPACVYGCSSSFKLCSEVPSSSSSSFSCSFFSSSRVLLSLLFLYVVVFIFSSSAPGRRSSSLARAGERHRTTENKVFLRFPVLSSLAPSLSRHFRVEYTRERRGFISASARGMRGRSAHRKEL